MSQITLTVSMNKRNPDLVSVFEWSRDRFGQGFWVAKTKFGSIIPNQVVHQDLAHDLSSKAREQGLTEQYDFSMSPPKEEEAEKAPKSKTRKSRKSKVGKGLLSGFNPFALSFPSEG